MATYSVFLCGNPMDRGAWQAAVQGLAESDMTATKGLQAMITPVTFMCFKFH